MINQGMQVVKDLYAFYILYVVRRKRQILLDFF